MQRKRLFMTRPLDLLFAAAILGVALASAGPSLAQGARADRQHAATQEIAVTTGLTIEQIVDQQQLAYNARDLDAFCAFFAADIVLLSVNDGREIARGIEDVRVHFARRFKESPKLHVDVENRIVAGDFVIDHELVTGIRDGVLEVVAMYEVRDGRIQSLRFLYL